MSADDEKYWATFFADCAKEIPDLGADELDDELLIDYDLEDCIEQRDGQESMQGPSEEAGSCPRASDPQGSGQDPGRTHEGDDNAPRGDVSNPRDPKDVDMTDAPPERDAVIDTEGGRAEGNLVAPSVREKPRVPLMQGRELTGEQARQRSIQQAMAMQLAQAIEPIWRAAPERTENMARRTAIVVGLSSAQYSTRVAGDANREANWQAKGLAPLAITDEELADIKGLREATIEFAALTSRNHYIPMGYNIDDLLKVLCSPQTSRIGAG